MASLNITLRTLQPGVTSFPASGGVAVADTDTLVRLSIDRTVAGGFNSLSKPPDPAASSALIYSYQSNDGGASWKWIAGDQVDSGVYTSAKTGQWNTAYVEVVLDPGSSRLVRATVTVTGASVAVAGSLTTS